MDVRHLVPRLLFTPQRHKNSLDYQMLDSTVAARSLVGDRIIVAIIRIEILSLFVRRIYYRGRFKWRVVWSIFVKERSVFKIYKYTIVI